MKRRTHSVIKAGAVHHIYQNTPNGYLIFYSTKDYLVFYSIVSVVAKRYGIQILGICPMVDHIHLLVFVREPEVLRAFVRDYTSLFALKYNKWYGFKGPVFNTPFGCAPKLGHKKIRTAIAYVYNNPVECHLIERAEQARWNFLAYAAEKAPFSEKLRMDYARWELRKALRWVKVSVQSGSPLAYALLEKTTRALSIRELRQFVDYVIRQYTIIDYDALTKYYGTYEDLIRAVNSNTGSEYDIEEDTFAKDHRVYKKMIARLCTLKGQTMKEVLALPYEERFRLGRYLKNSIGASGKEAAKLLRL